MRAIVYSLCKPLNGHGIDLPALQLQTSVQSLRIFNQDLHVYVFLHGLKGYPLGRLSSNCHTTLVDMPTYEASLREICGSWSAVFRHYPVLHKWLALKQLVGCRERQLLYADCDTVFLSDPAKLFDYYSACHWYAREEPYSSCSSLGYDPTYLDESALGTLAAERGAQNLPTMNLGVVLLNHRIWAHMNNILGRLFDEMSGFLLWLAQSRDLVKLAEPRMDALMDAVVGFHSGQDSKKAVRYPSSNFWIVEQIAMLLSLGQLQGFRSGLLRPAHVAQGLEFQSLTPSVSSGMDTVVCHYYSKNWNSFASWYQPANLLTRNA